MCRDVKLLYDVTADTIGYIPVQVDAASLWLAMVQLRSIHCTRASRVKRS